MLRSVKALFTSIVLDGILAVVGVLAGCGNPPQALPSPKRGPTISEINDQRILEDQSTTVAFTVGDPETPLTQLQLSALSSDQSLLPTNNIVFEGIGAKRKAVIQPPPHWFGATMVTIRVSDGLRETNRSFRLKVEPIIPPPIMPWPNSEQIGAANQSQPVSPKTNRAPAAAGSGR